MQDLIKINGRYYDVAISSIKREADITDGENAGRSAAPNYNMIRDIIGTFFSYKVEFTTRNLNYTEYDALYEALVQPQDSISVEMPYGQGTLAFDAYVTKVEDELTHNLGAGKRRWEKLSVTFSPMKAKLRG